MPRTNQVGRPEKPTGKPVYGNSISRQNQDLDVTYRTASTARPDARDGHHRIAPEYRVRPIYTETDLEDVIAYLLTLTTLTAE